MYGDFFFFKQKTAYEMRISDWSSDVCSSDLGNQGEQREDQRGAERDGRAADLGISGPLRGRNTCASQNAVGPRIWRWRRGRCRRSYRGDRAEASERTWDRRKPWPGPWDRPESCRGKTARSRISRAPHRSEVREKTDRKTARTDRNQTEFRAERRVAPGECSRCQRVRQPAAPGLHP